MTANDVAPETLSSAACIGGGVIGAGWAARLLLNGVDVALFDPDPQAGRKVGAVVAAAERAFARLTTAPLPRRGRLSFAGSIEEAVTGVAFVQESVPERLDLKRRILVAIDAAAPAEALIGSSTSGLLPSEMQADLAHPERLVVAHPFNPVYLLPLVEIVGGAATSPETIARAQAVYAGLGMKPVVIAREIEAFVGDRLLEAMWREALWLVKDGVATVEEIDDVIRYAFGLRFAQMGLFQTYRIAGGEAGMRHFLGQFGPALKWPWTKLMDVPDLDDALIDRIVSQSDAQAAGLDVRMLERIRDDNLVAILKALKAQNGGAGWGAGRQLGAFEDALRARAARDAGGQASAQLRLHETEVAEEWVDYNGHMTEHRYLQVFGDTTDALLAHIGVDAAYLASGRSYYTVETHIRHLGEAKAGDAIATRTQVVTADAKRIHVMHALDRAATGETLATAEQMLLHVDTRAGKAAPAGAEVAETIARIAAVHAGLPSPPGMGRHVGQSLS